ncbi:MAG TPA: hypothetical protein VNC82_20150 [Candidatus Limnocylindria bacterium]|nr:hypothetical protein [Candidatus Limnocylindria bacterium]
MLARSVESCCSKETCWRSAWAGLFAMTLGEAQDLLTTLGEPLPITLYEVAECLAASWEGPPP